MSAFRFVHTADIHLDSPLRSLAFKDAELADLIGNATRQAFVNIIDLCLHEKVDALLIAGDLYDGEQTSMKTARFLAGQLQRLHEANIRVFIIRGNHDAQSRITRELVLPENVKIFGSRAEAHTIDRGRDSTPVVVHGLSFAHPEVLESLLPEYRPPVPGALNIGMMHTSLGGSPGHDPYAPCSVAELQRSGFHYWALGHIHKRSEIRGDCTIVMPGIPQGRHIGEAGPLSVSLVTLSEQDIQIEERAVSIAQFERVTVDASRIEDWRELVRGIGAALQEARDACTVDHLVVRLELAGKTPLAWSVRRDLDLLKAEADEQASMVGRCSVEKLEAACRPPTAGAADDPVSELRALMVDQVAPSDGFRSLAMDMADTLAAQLPPECRKILGGDEAERLAVLDSLLEEGLDEVVAHLHAVTRES